MAVYSLNSDTPPQAIEPKDGRSVLKTAVDVGLVNISATMRSVGQYTILIVPKAICSLVDPYSISMCFARPGDPDDASREIQDWLSSLIIVASSCLISSLSSRIRKSRIASVV